MKNLFLLLAVITLAFQSCSSDDDIVEVPIIDLLVPINLSVSDITQVSAVLNWENPNVDQDVKVEYGVPGFSPGTGIVVLTSQNSVSIDGLYPGASFDFYVYAISSNAVSMESKVESFNTIISPFAGRWTGTYDGGDTGRWTMMITDSGLFMSGSNYSNNANQAFNITSGTITADGVFNATYDTGGVSEGQITGTTMSGTWTNPTNGLSGTWTGSLE